ncbi:MAG TPA: Yip1 family protein [Usitatibacter sp.]|nr:Yip1 family protein [Usitatibacter sp.]
MSLVERAKNIIVTPKTEWQVVAGEATPPGQLIVGYVLPLAAIAAIAGFIGIVLVGAALGHFGVHIGIVWAVAAAVYQVVMSVIMVYVMAFIIDALAPTFGAQKAFPQALKVAVYCYTPVWVMGIVKIIPFLGILVLLAAIYAIYLLYLGLQGVMRAPSEKAAGYTAVVVIVGIVVAIVINVIGGIIMAAGTIGAGAMGGYHMGSGAVTYDRDSTVGRLDEFSRKMEEANRRMEQAQKSGDSSQQAQAAMAALGTALSGGKGVEPVQLDQLKPFVPEKFAGLERTDMRTDRSGVKGFMVAKAEGVYGDGAGKRVNLEVTDTGGAAGLVGLASWMGVQGEHEDSQRREVTRQDGDRLVHEAVDKHGGPSEYTVILGQRFVVSAHGRGIDLPALESGVNGLDLAKLSALQ